MSLKDLVPDPSLLFRFSFDAHYLPTVSQIGDPMTWGLGASHLLPALDELSPKHNSVGIKLGWNEQGLFFEAEYLPPLKRNEEPFHSKCMAEVFVNTRHSDSIQGFTDYCSNQVFGAQQNQAWQNSLIKMSLNDYVVRDGGVVRRDNLVSGTFGVLIQKDPLYTVHLYIDAASMKDYRPDEFPDLGLYFYLRDQEYGRAYLSHALDKIGSYRPQFWNRIRLIR